MLNGEARNSMALADVPFSPRPTVGLASLNYRQKDYVMLPAAQRVSFAGLQWA
jgi:hypothetical protein